MQYRKHNVQIKVRVYLLFNGFSVFKSYGT